MSEQQREKATSLWRLRLVFIACFIFIATAIGANWASLQPQKSLIEAQLEKPNVAELNNYYALLSTYRLVNEESKMSDAQITELVYQAFVKQLSSQALLKEYLQQQALITNLALYQAIALERQLQSIIDDVVVQQQNGILYISWLSPIANHQLAQQLIEGWIQQANSQAKQLLYADLVHKWKSLFQQVKLAAENNLAQSWKGKLQIMRSVQPLDDKLVAYRYLQPPQSQQNSNTYQRFVVPMLIAGSMGGLLGLLFSVLFIRRHY